MICPVLVEEEDFERLSKQVLSLGLAHDKLVDTVKAHEDRLVVGDQTARRDISLCRTELNTLQEQIEESPGNWKVSKDISRLTDRIEKLEELLQSGKNVTVHSRLNDMEICIREHGCQIISQNQSHNEIHRNIEKLETCCKNVVASGKALEERIDRVDKNMNILSIEVSDASKRTQRADKFMDKLRTL